MFTELHRHLDVSIRPQTLLKLAQDKGLEGQSTSVEAFKSKIVMRQPMTDLSTVLAQFGIFQKVLDRAEVLERVAFEVVEDCWQEGTRKVELRYSPHFVSQYSPLSWEESLAAFRRGIDLALYRYPDMKAGLICIASRDAGSEITDRGVEFFLKNRNQFIGIDLAGNEAKFPCRLYQASFKKVIDAGAPITIHAGEASGPDSVWEAIELLGAQRIGHGVSSIQDPKLVSFLAEKRICLEMCPTSNWLTQAVPSLENHPLPKLLRAGVPISINTDDPGVFGVTLGHEIQVCREQMGLTLAEIEMCRQHASRSSFIKT
jgi:adenosine deaminase